MFVNNDMNFIADSVGDLIVVTLLGESLDASTVQPLSDQVIAMAEDHMNMLIDLRHVTFLDSSGLGLMLRILRRLKLKGGELKLCCTTPPVRSLLDLVRMNQVLRIFDNQRDGVASFGVEY